MVDQAYLEEDAIYEGAKRRTVLGRLLRRLRTRTNEQRIRELRRMGVKIGESCRIVTMEFSTEPYLIEIGDNVVIAGGVQFITHEGFARMIRYKYPGIQVFGRIRVGSGTMIGLNSMLLPGVEIGRNCLIGAGSVVRGTIPDNSLVAGNPGRVVGKASLMLAKLASSRHRLDLFNASSPERRRRIEEHFHRT
jgi:acetyltransferase-like isoleucine patch superfamily enzyme